MRQVKKDSTNISVDLYIIDATDGTPETGVVFNTTGIDLEYRREGAVPVNITEINLTTPALTDAHEDGGFLEIGHGYYRLDVLDAAFATGASTVSIQGTVTGMIVLPQTIQLVDNIEKDVYDRIGAAGASLSDLGGMSTGMKGEVKAEADTALSDYGANTTTPPTVSQIQAEMEENGASLLDTIRDELANGTDGLSALKTLLDTLIARLTAARAGYLDNLNIGGNVAGSSEVLAIQNNTRVRVIVPQIMERPDSSSTLFKLHLYLYDTAGNMEAPDSLPTITAENQSGANRDSNLGTVIPEAVGHYSVTYSLASGDSIEQLLFLWAVIEGGVGRLHGSATQVVDTTAVDFTAADRTKLDGIQTDLDNGTDGLGALKDLIDAVASVTTLLPDAGALTTIGTDTARLTAARAQVLTDWIDTGRLDAILDELTSQGDTNETKLDALPGSATILTTALVESYAADGSTATLTQLMYMILSMLTSLKFVGTTGTSRKLDGTTPAMTFTIDDADDPTDINRTT